MPLTADDFRFKPGTSYRPHILLDSGAYTAWRSGSPIDIDQYSQFLHKHEGKFAACINLDQIVPHDAELGAELSRKNYLYLRERGNEVIPVFHQGEDLRHLYQMLDDGATYICLAGTPKVNSAQKILAWYEIAWNALVNSGGHPHVKVHGLGDTKESSLRTYPWYSVDSSSWGQTAGRRAWATISDAEGKFTFSMRNDRANSGSDVFDIDSLSESQHELLRTRLAAYDLDLNILLRRDKNAYVYRLLLSALQYKLMGERLSKLPRPTLGPANSLIPLPSRPDKAPIPEETVRIYLASLMTEQFNAVFQMTNYPDILLSYAYLGGLESKIKYGYQLMGLPYANRPSGRPAKTV